MPKSVTGVPSFQQITKLSQLVTLPDLEAAVIRPRVAEAIASLAPSKPSSSQSQLLLSPPNQGAFTLDGLSWHTDLASSKPDEAAGIQAFVLLDDVDAHGGATLVLSGSHLRMGDKRAAARIRAALRTGRDGLEELEREGLSIVELSGKAGDVYLMDMRVLHTPSINASHRLRMVATVRYFF